MKHTKLEWDGELRRKADLYWEQQLAKQKNLTFRELFDLIQGGADNPNLED